MASIKKFVSNSNPYAKYKNITQQPSPYQLINDKNERKPETNLNENLRKNLSHKSYSSKDSQQKAVYRESFDRKTRENEKSSQEYSTKYTQNTDSITEKPRLKISINTPNHPIPISDYLFIGGERTYRSSASTKVGDVSPYFPRVQTSNYVFKWY